MAGERELLQSHTVVVQGGRILEIVAADTALQRYAPRVSLERPSHLLMPGLVNAHTSIGSAPDGACHAGRGRGRAARAPDRGQAALRLTLA